jgi:hypothetical protein
MYVFRKKKYIYINICACYTDPFALPTLLHRTTCIIMTNSINFALCMHMREFLRVHSQLCGNGVLWIHLF